MKTILGLGIAAVLAAGAAASAAPVLQFDVNGFSTQSVDSANTNSPFGGLTHTGAVVFTTGGAALNGIFIQSTFGGAFDNANFSGFTLTGFTGQVNLSNGQVTGGSITLGISNGDAYTCDITPGIGAVSTYVGGGFKIEALTGNGLFNDSQFGNVNVSPWSGAPGGNLPGSFLEFNFNPDASGFTNSDMDLFVDVTPLPPAAWGAMATLAGLVAARRMRRR